MSLCKHQQVQNKITKIVIIKHVALGDILQNRPMLITFKLT